MESQAQQPTTLFRVNVRGGAGYIDATGAIAIAPRFFEAGDFSEGLALASLDGKEYGYIDPTGQFAIRPQFNNASSFHEGRAAVCIKGKWGYIDNNGVMVVPVAFDHASHFEGGTASVASLPVGSGTLAGYLVDIYRYRWTYIDRDGIKIGNPKFQGARPDELLPLRSGKMLGYINGRGDVVIAPRFEIASRFREGLAMVAEGGQIGYIGPDGHYRLKPQFAEGADFQDGLARVARDIPAGQVFGLIDRSGNPIVPFVYSELSTASEELFAFRSQPGGKVGYMSKDGVVRIPPLCDHGFSFKNGLAEVSVDRKQCYIDKKGRMVWDGRRQGQR